ncbi:S-layer family protein [Bdellovibrio sp. KM01]|uniref:beta strand repeat-containing protein n=1 Tax=Bdellovibrio sp. KM01 TaxID=2748865 RepID=UPI0015E906C9|nr:LamG-like jellyroll fold domain-containing protein [Bdellovibrio sp. KM01]QLY24964.1 Ig-like domain-containing protein [Bdellovibrio sp. KM01]
MMKLLLSLIAVFTFTACSKKGSSIESGFLAGVSISAGASTITLSSSSILSGNSTTVTLTTRDSEGNIFHIPGGNPNVQFSTSGGTSTGIFSPVTNNNDGTYVSTFSGSLSGTETIITASVDGVELETKTAKVTVLPANYSLANSYVTLSATTVASRSTITATFHAMDASNNPITNGGMNVVFGIDSGTSTGTFATTTDNGDGTYTSIFTGKLVGTAAAIKASVAGLAITSTLPTVTVTPGTATAIAVNAGNSQSAAVNNALGSSLKVKVTDAEGNAVPSVQVDWTTTGNSALGAASDNTDSSGISTNTLTLGTVTGVYTVTAKIHGTTTTTTFSATATPGAINNFLLSGVPANATAGTAFNTTVTARDSYNNVKTDYTGTVQFTSSDSNSPTLPGNYTFVSGDAGVKQFSFNLKTTGNQTITVTQSGGSPTITSSAISVSAASIYQLIYIANPTNTVAGNTISTVTIRAVDIYANTISSFNGNVTVAIGTNAGSGTLSGTKVVAASSGTATFSDLSIEKSGTGYTFSATAAGVSAAVSSTFNITPDSPASIAVSSGNNQSATISTALGANLVAIVKDAYGNNVPSVTVDWSTTAGTLGSASSNTNSSGLASNSLTLSSTTGAHTVTASIPSSAFSTTFTATATNGPASQLSFSTQPVGGVTPGTALATQPVIRILDASGNLVTTGADATATVSLALTTGTGSLGGTTSLSAVGGVATFTNVNVSTYGTGKIVTATKSGTIMSGGTGSISLASNSFDITQSAPTAFTISSVAVVEADKLRVTWGSSTNANSYTVKYGTSAGNYTTTASTSGTSPFDITGLTGGTTYYIMVTAVNTATSVDATSEAMGIPISAFTLTSLTPGVGSSSLAFASAAGATTYDVLYDTSSHTASQTYASTNASVTSPATTSSLSTGTTYYYRVRANNSFGSLVSTNELSGAVYQNFTLNIPFTAGSEANYSISNSTTSSLTGGSAVLKQTPLTDSSSSEFTASTLTDLQWDSTLGAVRLNATGNNVAALDSTWTPQWNSLVAYWKLDNNFNDSVGSYTATNNGSVPFSTPGRIGSHSATFSTTSTYGSVAAGPDLSGSFTISAWVYPTGAGSSFRTIASYGNSSGNNTGWYLQYTNAGYVRFQFSNTSDALSPYAYLSADRNKWVHIVATYDGTSKLRTIYRNGLRMNGSTATGNITTVNGAFKIGVDYDTTGPWLGNMDDIAVWNTALTTAEVSALYNHQAGTYAGKITSRVMDAQAYNSTDTSWLTLSARTTVPFYKEIPSSSEAANYSAGVGTLHTGLKAIWHFNESSWPHSANDVVDSSGNGNHGTSYGNARIYTTGLGKFGNTGSWNASGDYVVATASSNFIATDNQPFSISAWIYPNAIGNTGATTIDNRIVTIHRGSTAGASIALGLGLSNKLMLYSYNNGGTELNLASTASLSVWQWSLVTATFDGTCVQLYINGVATGSCTNTFVNAGGSYGLRIGNHDTTTLFFRGYMDEVGVWSKALSANEIKEMYRRFNNRIRYQVRSCTTNDCSDQAAATNAGWKGPDNTGSTFFSELFNTSTNTVGGAILGTAPTMTFSNFAGLSVASNRYFQYRAFFDNEDTANNCTYNSAAAPCSPELKSITVGATRYDSTAPTYTATGASVTSAYQVLDGSGFTETLGANGCSAGAKYALSADGSTFYYYDGSAWSASSDYSTASSAAQINAGLSTFAATAGTGTLRVKAFLKSSNTSQCEIDNLSITGKKY